MRFTPMRDNRADFARHSPMSLVRDQGGDKNASGRAFPVLAAFFCVSSWR